MLEGGNGDTDTDSGTDEIEGDLVLTLASAGHILLTSLRSTSPAGSIGSAPVSNSIGSAPVSNSTATASVRRPPDAPDGAASSPDWATAAVLFTISDIKTQMAQAESDISRTCDSRNTRVCTVDRASVLLSQMTYIHTAAIRSLISKCVDTAARRTSASVAASSSSSTSDKLVNAAISYCKAPSATIQALLQLCEDALDQRILIACDSGLFSPVVNAPVRSPVRSSARSPVRSSARLSVQKQSVELSPVRSSTRSPVRSPVRSSARLSLQKQSVELSPVRSSTRSPEKIIEYEEVGETEITKDIELYGVAGGELICEEGRATSAASAIGIETGSGTGIRTAAIGIASMSTSRVVVNTATATSAGSTSAGITTTVSAVTTTARGITGITGAGFSCVSIGTGDETDTDIRRRRPTKFIPASQGYSFDDDDDTYDNICSTDIRTDGRIDVHTDGCRKSARRPVQSLSPIPTHITPSKDATVVSMSVSPSLFPSPPSQSPLQMYSSGVGVGLVQSERPVRNGILGDINSIRSVESLAQQRSVENSFSGSNFNGSIDVLDIEDIQDKSLGAHREMNKEGRECGTSRSAAGDEQLLIEGEGSRGISMRPAYDNNNNCRKSSSSNMNNNASLNRTSDNDNDAADDEETTLNISACHTDHSDHSNRVSIERDDLCRTDGGVRGGNVPLALESNKLIEGSVDSLSVESNKSVELPVYFEVGVEDSGVVLAHNNLSNTCITNKSKSNNNNSSSSSSASSSASSCVSNVDTTRSERALEPTAEMYLLRSRLLAAEADCASLKDRFRLL